MEPEGSLPPPAPILSRLDPVHTPTSHFLKFHPNIILPPTPCSPEWSLSLRFLHQNLYTPLLSPIHATYPAHHILLDFITQTVIGEEYRSLSSSSCSSLSALPSYLVTPRPKYSHQHSILKHPQPTFVPQCQRPSFIPIQNNRQNIVLYILIFKYLDSELENEIFCTE